MNKNKILQSDYLDILFDGRNKSYGGYMLRKNVNRRYAKSMAVLLGLCLSIVTYSVIGKAPVENLVKPIHGPTVLADVKPLPIEKPKPPIKATPPATPKPKVKALKLTPPKIEKDNKVKEEDKPPEQSELKNAVVGNKNIEGDSIDTDISIVGTGKGGVLGIDTKEEMPVKYVEQMPEALYDLNDYLNKNISYPRQAKENNIEGRVIVQFVVNEDGGISGANVVGKRFFGGGLEDEALRVVSSMPKWRAGKQNGTAVKVYFTLPISFRLE